jgi:hypothetical protein
MKDKKRSDEKLFNELDTMYQRVADLERKEAASEHPSNPYEYGETTEEAPSNHGTVVSSPGHRTHAIPGKELMRSLESRSRKNWARTGSGSTAA